MKNARKRIRITFSARIMIYLLIAYVLMAVMFGGMHFVNSREATSKRLTEQISHSLDRTKSDLETTINQVESLYLNLLFDKELYDILVSFDPGTSSRWTATSNIQTILYGYLRNLDQINTLYLLSDDYVFYTTNTSYTSILNVNKSKVYQKARNSEQAFWTSYDFVEEYGHTILRDKSLPIDDRNLISFVGQYSGFRMERGLLQMWPSDIEKPVVSVCISTDTIRSLLNSTPGPYKGQCFLLDEDGKYIVHPDESMLYQQFDPSLFAEMNNQHPSGNFRTDYDGRDSLFHYAKLSNGWTVAMAVPSSEAYSEIQTVVIGTLINMLVVALVLSLLLALLVSHSLSRPIRQLLLAIKETGGGNFMVSIPPSGDEFDKVYASFNEMNRRIEMLIRENYDSKLRERENELRALKYQTKPHFLYNALTIIRTVAARNGDDEAAGMIQNLSNVLRYVLRGDQNLVTVRDEINNVMDYFDLMHANYDDALLLEMDVEPSVLNAAICKMTLQPLVENCVQHGLSDITPQNPGIIRITGRMIGSNISLIVSDNGAGWPESFSIFSEEHSTESIGLANVSRRMHLTFGDRCEFRTLTPAEGGAAVEIIFPYQFGQSPTTNK